MNDDYDYDWNYPAKTEEGATTGAKKGSAKDSQRSKVAKADRASATAQGDKRNPDRNETGEREKDTSIAVACLVFGIISLLSSWLIIGLGFGIAAIVLAIIVIKNRYYGKGYAIGGLVTSIIGLLSGIILPIVIITSARRAIDDLKNGIMDLLTNGLTEYASELLPEYIEEIGHEYIRQYIDEVGEDYVNDLLDSFSQ